MHVTQIIRAGWKIALEENASSIFGKSHLYLFDVFLSRANETNDDWNERLDLQKERQQKLRDSLEGAKKRKFQDKDASRKQKERENEPEEKKKLRKEKK